MTEELNDDDCDAMDLELNKGKYSSDKEIDDIIYKSGEYIFNTILKKMDRIKVMAYKPSCIILWEDYYRGLYEYATKKGLYCFGEKGKPRLCGLDIMTTQLPDTIEVY